MRLFPHLALLIDRQHLLRRFWQSASLFWFSRKAWVAGLAVLLVGIVVLQLLVQLLLNIWNRNFFNALERKDAHELWVQTQLFVPLAAASIFLAATSVWGRMTAQRSWREALTRHVIDYWLANDHYRHLNNLIKGSENPEYRISEDVRIATDAPIDLVLAFFSSIITALAFFGVLWTVGGSIDVPLFGLTVTIPGYLVIAVIVYSGVLSTLMMMSGHRLTGVIERKNQAEAELRASAEVFRDHAQPPSERGDGGQKETLFRALHGVLLWWRELCWQLVRTTFVSHGNFLLGPVVAWVLCVPKYLTGAMTLGELTQSAAAFVTVQGAFNWLIDNYQRLADWQSSAHRVANLLIAIDELERSPAQPPPDQTGSIVTSAAKR